MRAPVFFLALAFANLVHGQYSWVGTYAGNGQNGLVNGPLASSQFNTPYGIAVDDNTQTMFVADAFNNCIRKIQYGVVSTLAGSGTSGDVDGQGAYARLSLPSGVFLHDGYLYFSDNNNHKTWIQPINATGCSWGHAFKSSLG